MKPGATILKLATAVAALLLTAAGAMVLFVAPPAGPVLPYLLNPGALLVGWLWPEGAHSDAPLAALAPWILLAADFALWWALLYLPLRRLLRRRK